MHVLSRLANVEPTARPSRPRSYAPPPVPEPRNYSRRGESGESFGDDDSSARSYFRLTIDGPRRQLPEERRALPSLTPNFAPAAAAATRRAPPIPRSIVRMPPVTRLHDFVPPSSSRPTDGNWHDRGNAADGDDDGSDTAVGFPPLRRMGRRTIADGPLPASSLRESWSPTTMDGLGDRERSISPVVDDHWETMLSSVAPDPIPPTADSSFTSAAASASFSNSNPSSRAGSSNSHSASSSRTHLTIPSRRPSFDQFLRACDTSEDDSASDTEPEEYAARAEAYRRRNHLTQNPRLHSRRRQRNLAEDTAFYAQSFYREVTPHELGRRSEEHLQNQPDGPLEERSNTDEEMPLDQELRDARNLLERLTQRGDISDEFWASVGLRRRVAAHMERLQQRYRW